MAPRTIVMTEPLYDYLCQVSLREPEVLAELRAETASLEFARMQIGPEQGQFMALLVELTGARRVLEVGTFTGYSALAVALALPPEGRVLSCDVSEDSTAIARRFWAKAGVADKIELRLAPALETLDAELANGAAGTYDFMFIDADKENYDGYYERGLKVLRPGGLMAIDNVLWSGAVIDQDKQDEMTLAIRALNAKLKDDPRIHLSMVPIGDGLTLARKL
jgi:caffeoyl-CoA O-methyltransferase